MKDIHKKNTAANIMQTTVNQCFAIGFPSFAYPLAESIKPVYLGSFKRSSKKEMQDFIRQAEKNGVVLKDTGRCQFCGADTTGGVFECVALYSTGFDLVDFSNVDNHVYRFLSVDAHALQHPEIHGRWNNHFHLTRLHLILKLDYQWDYNQSPLLSNYLNEYKKDNSNEVLIPPKPFDRGAITTTDILKSSKSESDCTYLIKQWASSVYDSWIEYHNLTDGIAKRFVASRY